MDTTVILSAIVVVLVVLLYFYNKRTSAQKNDLINTLTGSVITVLTDYIKENGKKEAKDFDELADYVVYVKDYLYDRFVEMVDNSETIPEKMKKFFTDDLINSLIDDIIANNMELLEKTFTDAKKKPRTRKKKETALPEEAK